MPRKKIGNNKTQFEHNINALFKSVTENIYKIVVNQRKNLALAFMNRVDTVSKQTIPYNNKVVIYLNYFRICVKIISKLYIFVVIIT